ncbi:MAG: hypothetical protein HC904_13850, partial [Blastochloris sp.]|nr:hypothetical protein [Blastochloris sp.]
MRHRLQTFAERLDELERRHGKPDQVVLEFVRQDFMGEKTKKEYQLFLNKREKERKQAREEAKTLGATAGNAGLKLELYRAQKGHCLYSGDPLFETELENYQIEHIVPRSRGGPDAVINYVLTTRKLNDLKGECIPHEWDYLQNAWDAYVNRVEACSGNLRNKKVNLLLSSDAVDLVQKYTALAETAWISKLAQTILSLKFGWQNGINRGERKITVVSGGLTARIRRKYRLNSLLAGEGMDEEEAEKKNRKDDRHHALDAMVINFLPTWMNDTKKEHFFRFPDPIQENPRGYFQSYVEKVVPQQ